MTQHPSETVVPESAEFAALLQEVTTAPAQERIGERLMNLNTIQRSAWLLALVQWLGNHGPRSLRPVASSILKAVPHAASGRPAAVRLTMSAALHHPQFRTHLNSGDDFRDKHQFGDAEHEYWQALKIFPLHGGVRVQYAHALKEQQKYEFALLQYCFALSAGAPLHDVAEHLLFAANRAGVQVAASDVERLAGAWSNAEQSEDDWDAPPVYEDFFDFARLFWGNTGLLTNAFMQQYLPKCTTRKSLFIALLGSQETARHNREFFVMINEQGGAGV